MDSIKNIQDTFVIANFDFQNMDIKTNEIFVFRKEIALKAGVVFSKTVIELTVPSLGEWKIFVIKDQNKHNAWLITNNYFLAEQVRENLFNTYNISFEIQQIEPGAYLNLLLNETNTWEININFRQSNLNSSKLIVNLPEAISVVEEALARSVSTIAQAKRPVMLLLSGGVDSGLLCSFLAAQNVDAIALSIKTPWGDELAGATATANHVGIPIITLNLMEEDLLKGLESTIRWTQNSNVEITLIQLLVTIAYEYAKSKGRDLITGMGSDLLNSASETGMESSASDQSLATRIKSVSSTGLFQTNGLGDDYFIHHPYWQTSTIYSQLSVDPCLKANGKFEKFYLRKLAERRLPEKIAFGYKTAIHQGSNLTEGLTQTLAPETLEQYIEKLWNKVKSQPKIIG